MPSYDFYQYLFVYISETRNINCAGLFGFKEIFTQSYIALAFFTNCFCKNCAILIKMHLACSQCRNWYENLQFGQTEPTYSDSIDC